MGNPIVAVFIWVIVIVSVLVISTLPDYFPDIAKAIFIMLALVVGILASAMIFKNR